MRVELDVVFGYNCKKSFFRFFNFYKFKNLGIIFGDLRCQCVRTDVNNINIGVFQIENTCNLCIFFLFVMVNRLSFGFRNRIRINMDFHSFLLLNFRPAILKFFLHFAPYSHTFIFESGYFDFSWLFQLIKTILPLNNCSLCHKKFKLIKSWKSFVSSPDCLDFNCCKCGTIRPFEHDFRISHGINQLSSIDNTFKQIFFDIFIFFQIS